MSFINYSANSAESSCRARDQIYIFALGGFFLYFSSRCYMPTAGPFGPRKRPWHAFKKNYCQGDITTVENVTANTVCTTSTELCTWLGQKRERERHQGGKREDFQIQLTSSASFRVLAYKAEGRDKGGWLGESLFKEINFFCMV